MYAWPILLLIAAVASAAWWNGIDPFKLSSCVVDAEPWITARQYEAELRMLSGLPYTIV